MDLFIHYAPTIALLFFFIIFIGIAIWLMRPATKEHCNECALIPLQEDH